MLRCKLTSMETVALTHAVTVAKALKNHPPAKLKFVLPIYSDVDACCKEKRSNSGPVARGSRIPGVM
jgi:hypothetical protein